jgi:hypothetical protein
MTPSTSVFTLRMQPTRVWLRLMKEDGHSQMFLAVERVV